MITPTKSTPLKDSILFKMISILEKDFSKCTVHELYEMTKNDFSIVDDFLLSLDVLYILNLIEFNSDEETITKC
ncbi:ABC-three component system middle component 7 [Yersinia enterocolitica]|uniref:ABC-three component system middle component 7 n=1 Tax=Yersinia enterocolitica TaxID=630 RepID=UPI0005DEE2BD|nr:ABC-three component system middle component 7 [Yersinia enterocolitica]ELX2300594.1 hypothetical protein [Yersinia enterocolitica]CNL00480.1 Uncharacterised protein [Yersinia enterocolitica]